MTRTLRQTARLLQTKQVTPTDLVQRCLDKIKQTRHPINAVVTVASDYEEDVKQKRRKGPFDGIPFLVKDNVLLRGSNVAAASNTLKDFSSPIDASIVAQCRAAGMIPIGLTNMDEFGMGCSFLSFFNLETSATQRRQVHSDYIHHTAQQPIPLIMIEWRVVHRVICKVELSHYSAIGTDTGGSIRLPAAYCGLYAFKPSFDALSRHGLIQYAGAFDTMGYLAKSMEDLAFFHRTVITPKQVAAPRQQINIGLLYDVYPSGVEETFYTASADLAATIDHLGIAHTTHLVSLPSIAASLPAYYTLATTQGASSLARYPLLSKKDMDSASESMFALAQESTPAADVAKVSARAAFRQQHFGKECQRRIVIGNAVLAQALPLTEDPYRAALHIRADLIAALDDVFNEVDVLISPVTITPPPTKEAAKEMTVVETYMNDMLTIPISMAGLPTIVLPDVREDGRGTGYGLQLCAARGRDAFLLDIAEQLDAARKQ